MKLLTLTPETHAYAVALLVVVALACGPLTGFVQRSWPWPGTPRFFPLYAALMAVVVGVAIVVLELPTVTRGSVPSLSLAVPIGTATGLAAFWFDSLVRRFARRRPRHASRQRRRMEWSARTGPAERAIAAPAGDRAGRISMLALLLAVAALEEVLFRGVLVDLCLALRRPALVSICLAGTVAVFALSHVHWGWSEVLAKAGLGTLALLSVMGLETVAPAVVAHAVFNAGAWLAARSNL